LIGDQATTGSPSEDEITNFLEPGRIHTSHTIELRASHIVFRASADMTSASIEDNRLAAEDVLKKIRNGLDFATAARQYSQDRFTAWKGGDLGYFIAGGMFPEFERVAFSLPVGGVSNVVRTPVGFHIIKVTERHDNNARMLYQQAQRNAAVESKFNDMVSHAKVEKFL
jgi:parvulin-like peptidyl-prolyl isomerase